MQGSLTTIDEYLAFCKTLSDFIHRNLDEVKIAEEDYPRIVMMFEFFKIMRAEQERHFKNVGSNDQRDLYYMEDKLFRRVLELKTKVDTSSLLAKQLFETGTISNEFRI